MTKEEFKYKLANKHFNDIQSFYSAIITVDETSLRFDNEAEHILFIEEVNKIIKETNQQ